MEQQDSVRGELQTLIMLEQQQTASLDTISRQGAAIQAGGSMGGSGGYGAPRFGGLNNIPLVGDYTSQFRDFQRQYAQTSNFARTPVRVVSDIGSRINQRTDSDPTGFFFQNQSKVNAMQREAAGVNVGERFTTGTLSAASSLTSLAGNAVGGGIASALGGGMIAGGLAGAGVGAAASFVVATGADQMRQNYAYEKFLRNNSYKFIDLFETNNTRQPAGFNRQERWKMADYLRSFGTENKISDKDTMSLLQGFTNGNLLRGVSDAESFKKQMKSLTESTKKIALAWNTSFEDAVKAMEDMKKAGLDTRNYSRYAANAKIVGSITGQTGAEVGEFNMNLSQNIIARSGNDMLDANGIYNATSGIQAYVGKMYNDADKRLQEDPFDVEARQRYDLITNKGGIEGATEDFMYRAVDAISNNDNGAFSTITAGLYSWNGQKWVFDERKFQQFKNSGADLATLAGMGTETLNNAGYAAIADWQERSSMYTTSAFMNDPVKLASFLKTIVNAGGQMTELRGADTSTILSTVFGIKDNDKWLGTMVDAINGDGGDLYHKVRLATVGQELQDAYNSQRTGMGYQVTSWWNGVKDSIGNFFSPLANTFNKAGEYMSDWWYGQKYEDVRSLWNEVDWDNTGIDKLHRQLALYNDTDAMEKLGISGQFKEIDRDYYRSFDILVSKLENTFGKLGDAATDTASKMRDAADQYGVSESVMTQLFSAFDIKDIQSGIDLLKEYSDYQGVYVRNNKSASKEDVANAFLKSHNKEGTYQLDANTLSERIQVYTGSSISVESNPFGKQGIQGLAGQPDTWDLSSLVIAPSEAEKKQAIDNYFHAWQKGLHYSSVGSDVAGLGSLGLGTWINHQATHGVAGLITAANEDKIINNITDYDTTAFLDKIVGGTGEMLRDDERERIKLLNQSPLQNSEDLTEYMQRNTIKRASVYQVVQDMKNSGQQLTYSNLASNLDRFGVSTKDALNMLGVTVNGETIYRDASTASGNHYASTPIDTTTLFDDYAKNMLNQDSIEGAILTEDQYDKLNHLHQRTDKNGNSYYVYDKSEEIGYQNSLGGPKTTVKFKDGHTETKYLNKNINYADALSKGYGAFFATNDASQLPIAEYQKTLQANIQFTESEAKKAYTLQNAALTARDQFRENMGNRADAAEQALLFSNNEQIMEREDFIKQYGGTTEKSQTAAGVAYDTYVNYKNTYTSKYDVWKDYVKDTQINELAEESKETAYAQGSLDSTLLRYLGADEKTAQAAQRDMKQASQGGSLDAVRTASVANNQRIGRQIFGDALYNDLMDSANENFGNVITGGDKNNRESEMYKKVVAYTSQAFLKVDPSMSAEQAQVQAQQLVERHANSGSTVSDVLTGEQGISRQLATMIANSGQVQELDAMNKMQQELSANTQALNANTKAMKGKPTDYTPPPNLKTNTDDQEQPNTGVAPVGGP